MFDKLASIEMRLMEIDSQLSRADLSGKELTKLTREELLLQILLMLTENIVR